MRFTKFAKCLAGGLTRLTLIGTIGTIGCSTIVSNSPGYGKLYSLASPVQRRALDKDASIYAPDGIAYPGQCSCVSGEQARYISEFFGKRTVKQDVYIDENNALYKGLLWFCIPHQLTPTEMTNGYEFIVVVGFVGESGRGEIDDRWLEIALPLKVVFYQRNGVMSNSVDEEDNRNKAIDNLGLKIREDGWTDSKSEEEEIHRRCNDRGFYIVDPAERQQRCDEIRAQVHARYNQRRELEARNKALNDANKTRRHQRMVNIGLQAQ